MLSFPQPEFFLIFMLCVYLALNAKNFYSNLILRRALYYSEKLPARLDNLPTCQTSQEKFDASDKKVKDFMDSILSGKISELRLDSDDLNHIYLKGFPVNKYEVNSTFPIIPIIQSIHYNEYFYFQIEGSSILYTEVIYPSFEGNQGVQTVTEQMTFVKRDSDIEIEKIVSEFNGRDFRGISEGKYDSIFPLSKSYARKSQIFDSGFLFFLFGVVDSPVSNPNKHRGKIAYKQALAVINRISHITVKDDTLILKGE